MKAHGGGDGPEAVTAALADAFNLPWRPNATKICAAIADGNLFNKSWGTCKCWKMMINHVFGGIQKMGEKHCFCLIIMSLSRVCAIGMLMMG